MSHELGNKDEAMLSTALKLHATGVCPTPARSSAQAMAARTAVRVAPYASTIAIHTKSR